MKNPNEKLFSAIDRLIERAKDEAPASAMQLSQAALNIATAIDKIRDVPRN